MVLTGTWRRLFHFVGEKLRLRGQDSRPASSSSASWGFQDGGGGPLAEGETWCSPQPFSDQHSSWKGCHLNKTFGPGQSERSHFFWLRRTCPPGSCHALADSSALAQRWAALPGGRNLWPSLRPPAPVPFLFPIRKRETLRVILLESKYGQAVQAVKWISFFAASSYNHPDAGNGAVQRLGRQTRGEALSTLFPSKVTLG